MRAAERDRLLFVLAITSGSADAWSYMSLGHAFVANMTGNTVLLSIAIFGQRGAVVHPLISLISYTAGVAIGTFVTRKVRQNSVWPKAISGALFVEGLLMAATAGAWFATKAVPHLLSQCVLLGCLAAAIGIQSGAMLPLKLPGIVTTYITGTLSTLVSGLVLLRGGRERISGNPANFEDRLLVQAIFLAIYFLSAVAAGWSLRYAPMLIGGITSIPILIVAAYGAIRGD